MRHPDPRSRDNTPAAAPTRVVPAAHDRDIELRVPADDVADPEFSIVIPAMDEEVTISEFVTWCRQGLDKAGVTGEVIIVDSSSDRTPDLAFEAGARVLKTPKRGLGRAYIDAIPFIRGDWVIMGDADCTYDFRDLDGFIEKAREGYEFVMGSRFKGYIEPGAMPPHHRYFGNPLTTRILNILMSSSFSDIHCGMRMVSRDALIRMELQAQSWEYASEMILKAIHMHLRTSEVPVRFLKDPEGRESHLKRSGWTAPFYAGWISLKIMFVSGADFFLTRPGAVLFGLGSVLTLATLWGPVTIGPITFSLFWKLVGTTLAVVGLQSMALGMLAKVFYDYDGSVTARLLDRFRYTRAVAIVALLFVAGIGFALPMIVEYLRNDFALPPLGPTNFLAVTGLLLVIVSFTLFTFTLMLHAAASFVRRR